MAQPDSAMTITNTLFPPPPGYYKAFTPTAVARIAELEQLAGDSSGLNASGSPVFSSSQRTIDSPNLRDSQLDELNTLRNTLLPPRADWIRDDGRWMLFGALYSTEPHIPTVDEIGLPPLVTGIVSSSTDGDRAALPVLLRSFLHTLLALVDVLTGTARIPGELEAKGRASEGDQYIQHLSNLAATMMISANQLRGVQAEATLVLLAEKQLAERREQISQLRSKCRELIGTIRRLKSAAATAVSEGLDQ